MKHGTRRELLLAVSASSDLSHLIAQRTAKQRKKPKQMKARKGTGSFVLVNISFI
jgi:hypothetical protein